MHITTKLTHSRWRQWWSATKGNKMNETMNVQCAPAVEVQRSVGLMARLRVKWQNWKVSKTGRAYRHLRKAMQNDHGYAMTWQCNIACVIFDSNVCTQKQANEVADKLMAHLFEVRKQPNDELKNAGPRTPDVS